VLKVAIEPPRTSDILELLRLGDEYGLSLYPAESYYGLDIDDLEKPGVSVFVARDGTTAAGIVALVDRGDTTAEIKRMFVSEAARGLGVAGLLIAALEQYARSTGLTVIQLETGPKQPAAISLYEKHGYQHIAQFGQYIGDASSVCMQKAL